jgi:SAM-dependent methyltransferase
VAKDVFIPWLASSVSLAEATVLEFGSGQGAVSSAFAETVGRHIGYDIDADAVAYARKKVASRGLKAEFHAAPPDRILDAIAVHRGELDLLLLYAVLEHMTVAERLALLELAPSLLRPGGRIAVIELPNRLVIPDYHSSQLPFFSQLPDELALRYWERSPRQDFLERMTAATALGPADAADALTRWGRGASFHEFEVVFGDLAPHVIASSFDYQLLHERHVHREELALSREMERVRPDLAPCFSRYWLDFVLSPEPVDPATVSFMWPWTMETQVMSGMRWTPWDAIELWPEEPIRLKLPCATRRLVAGALVSEPEAAISAKRSGRAVTVSLAGDPSRTRYADLVLGRAVSEVELTLSHAGYLVFAGYEGPADRGLSPVA